MSLAAEFETFLSFSRRCLGQPERSELQKSSLERIKADTSVFVELAERRC